MRPGSWCPPTTSGTPALPFSACCSAPCASSTRSGRPQTTTSRPRRDACNHRTTRVVSMDVQGLLDDIRESLTPIIGQGEVADYIPGLAGVHQAHFGMAVVMPDGEAYGTGDWEQPFSIQSISKLFTLAIAYAHDGDQLWQRVSREPSGDPFNSLMQLELHDGIPRNPFINSGAIVVADRLLSLGAGGTDVLAFLREESGNPGIELNPAVAASEAEHGHRNAAIANLLASYGNLENGVPEVLEEYFRQCSIEASCRDLA